MSPVWLLNLPSCPQREKLRPKPASHQSRGGPGYQQFSADPNRIFLIHAMSFIFRAYHAMARQRGMSTKSGVPTAAVYVFVNMLRKLRDDFSPNIWRRCSMWLAPTFRDGGRSFHYGTKVRSQEPDVPGVAAYHGYKANRAEMPEDLRQQIPYIHRALDVYRIPILELARLRG